MKIISKKQVRFGGNEERSREDPRHTARRDGIRINGLLLWRLGFLFETLPRWAQNEEYLQAGIVFMQERMASAFILSTSPPVEEVEFCGDE